MEPAKEPTSQNVELHIGPLGQFAAKTAIVSVALVLSGWIMLDILDDFASRRMQQMDAAVRSIGGRQFWTKLEEELDKFADPRTDISPEKKQKILLQIRAISDRWRPFLNEAASSIAGESNQPPK